MTQLIPPVVLDTGVTTPSAADPGPDERGLSDEQVQSIVAGMLKDSREFIKGEISPDRATATEYYKGEPFGDEEEGRSSVVITVVRDTINSILPGIMRAFFGAEKVAQFIGTKPEDQAQAEQATDACEFIFKQDNPGFIIGLGALKDAFVKRMGVVKVWYEDESKVETWQATGLSQDVIDQLKQDQNITLRRIKEDEQPTVAEGEQPQPTFSCEVTERRPSGRVRVMGVPPEEFLFNRTARTGEDALLLGQWHETRVSELVKMGYDLETVLNAAAYGESETQMNPEEMARNDYSIAPLGYRDDMTEDPTSRRVLYCEIYPYLDMDGDGIAELRKVCTVGPAYMVVRNEPAAFRPYAIGLCDPEPHAFMGSSIADRTMDLQRIASAVTRGTLDSLNLAINQRMEVVDGQVSIADLMNPEIGGVIRVNQPGMLREIKHSFVGGDTLPFLQYLDEIKENRTGISKASAGLNPDALQSSTRAAVAATVSAAQQQIEMLARVAAETLFKQIYWLIYRTLVEHQDYARTMRLRGGYATIDPRLWDAELDLVVETPLSLSMTEDKLKALEGIVAKQEEFIQQLGPMNPLVNLSQLSYAVSKYVELSGFRDSSKYFNIVSPEQAKALAQAQSQQPQQPSPDIMLAQIEQQRVQMEAQLNQQKAAHEMQMAEAKLQLEQMKAQAEMALAREKAATDAAIRREQMMLNFEAAVQAAALKSGIQVNQQQIDADLQAAKQTIDAQLDAHGQLLDHAADVHATHVQAAVDLATAPDPDAESASD